MYYLRNRLKPLREHNDNPSQRVLVHVRIVIIKSDSALRCSALIAAMASDSDFGLIELIC